MERDPTSADEAIVVATIASRIFSLPIDGALFGDDRSRISLCRR